jgi:outer membrane protein
MKKYLLGIGLVSLGLTISSCNKAAEEEAEATEQDTAQAGGVKIAYVELDSLMNQYQLYKDYSEVLTHKGNNIQNTLAKKQRALESHAAAVQKKYESNGFTTRDELERAQAGIQREQQELAQLADRLNSEFNEEQARINAEAKDSIQSFLKRYNKTKKYDYVMVKAGDNLLIANPKYDITQDIVKGLNKRYKRSAEVDQQIKAKTETEKE